MINLNKLRLFISRFAIAGVVLLASATIASAQTDRDEFIVPDGTALVAVLNTDLTTKAAQQGDRFTMRVQSPTRFRGAVIEGRVGRTSRSGRATGRSSLALDFERIRLRNGRTYDFAGLLEAVRTADGESVQVDNEGEVKEGDNRTETTAKRGGIGAAAGAVIGAIAGGGKGAAIGAVVGGGAGAGSVYAQGRDDLDLRRGARLTIRASAPR